MMNTEVKVSIVVVEYHSTQEIQHCVTALKEHIHIPYEIIVSSNSCYDEQQKSHIDTSDEHVRWLFNSDNVGFANAMNEGLKVAQGNFKAIMNPDCILTSDIAPMIDFMSAHPEVGAVGPRMVDGEGNIQDTARPYVTLPRFLWRQVKRLVGHKASILTEGMDYSLVQTVDWVIGAFIMVSDAAYQATGGLDHRYFMYAEDLDWCTRIRQKGLEVVYYPKTTIIYKGTRRARFALKYAYIFLASHLKYWLRFGFFFGQPKRHPQTYL